MYSSNCNLRWTDSHYYTEFHYQLWKAYIATELKSPVDIDAIGYKIATYTNTGTDVILNYIERWNSVHTNNVKI